MHTGNLLKMKSEIIEGVVNYSLNIGDEVINMNEQLGKCMEFTYMHEINCIHCGRKTKTSYFQGYCYRCYTSLPQTDRNIVNPELDTAHLGISRDMEWAKKNSLTTHYVYLADSGEIKVGVTRKSQIPTRWIDQGADKAVIIAEAPNRHIAGTIEVFLKKFFTDKTKWKDMLGKKNGNTDIAAKKEEAYHFLHPEFRQYFKDDSDIFKINYPVAVYPELILQNINLERAKHYKGKLAGIKGQYLIFENGDVLNIRRHNGYKVELSIK